MAFSGVVLGLIAAIAGCGGGRSSLPSYRFKNPSGEPIKAVVRTTVPLAYAASVAMSAVTGSTPPNTKVDYTTCTTSPADCVAMITITDDDSVVPLQLTSGTGTITVYGYWASPTQAILTVSFSKDAGSTLFPVHNISLFPVLKNGSSSRIVYANVDINSTVTDPGTLTPEEIDAVFLKLSLTASGEASTNVSMNAWIIDRDDRNTPDVFDDTCSISGGGQYMEESSGSVSVLQLGMGVVVMGSDCLLNPNSGLAVLNEMESSSSNIVLANAVILFHPLCDGKADILAATGNYLLSNLGSIPLNLNNP